MIQLGMTISDRYVIDEKVGSGGMSIVYKAKDLKLGRTVAVKVLRDEFCYDDTFVGKFKVEAQAAASLSHPNIVNIYDVGNDGKVYYIVMEFLDGLTLKEHIKLKGHLEDSETMRIASSIASALECAHSNHIFHRDIKPQNIIITKDGRVKVADFGIARIATGATIPAADMASGSVHYIPPEQAKGGYTNEKSDIYSLGITMFEMVTGEVPFKADSAVSVALKQIHDELPDIRKQNGSIDQNLEQIIMKATQKKPELRYSNADAMLMDIKRANNFPQDNFVEIEAIDADAKTMVMNNTQMRQIWSESDVLEDEKNVADRLVVGGGVLAAVVLVAFVVNFVFSQFKEDIVPVEIVVPNLVGDHINDAGTQLQGLTLNYQVSDTVYSNEVAKDLIIEQVPAEGALVSENTVIQVRVSQGQELFKVPDLIARKDVKFSVAQELLRNAGLTPSQKQEYSDQYPVGIVFDQYPLPGEDVIAGAEVTIIVSLGKKDVYVLVPDVTRLPLDEAIAQLKVAGLSVGNNITEAYNDIIEEGNVIAMTATPGTQVKEGYEVDLTISLGEEAKPVTQIIKVNDILNQDEESVHMVVKLLRGSVEEIIFDSYVKHSSFDAPIEIPVSGFGTAIYEVYKNDNLEYTYQLKFTEEIVEE